MFTPCLSDLQYISIFYESATPYKIMQLSTAIFPFIATGDVNYGDILETLPYRDTLSIVELRGRHVLEVLEHSVSQYNTVDPWGGFLQYSGAYVCIGRFKVPF